MSARPAFTFGAIVELVVGDYRRAVLSLPAADAPLAEKDLLAAGPVADTGKLTLDEHLAGLVARGELDPAQPLLALGLRNSLVNLRAPVIRGSAIQAVVGEHPRDSLRPYFGLGAVAGRLTCGQALGSTGADWVDADFFCAAPPVLDPTLDATGLWQSLLIEVADHSHLFDLPRGNHPAATADTRAAWSALHDAFVAVLHADRPAAITGMQQALARLPNAPARAEDYFHAVLGTDADGVLYCVFAHGPLEALGERAAALGAGRAVCVENSGSIMPTLLPEGVAGRRIPLVRAPNFRPRGRALLVLELPTAAYAARSMLMG